MKKLHIIIILLGAIYIILGAFTNNVWFDETYTVGMIHQNLFDMIEIGIADVHPLLYYIVLKLLSFVFGNSIIILRIFSCLGIITLSILGFSHIRKDFGEKTGFIFSVLSIILPVMLLYGNEIRMYSWAAVVVTLTAIYAYRIIKENTIKNWILFAIFSLMSAYIHYYATMAIALINIVLFFVIFKQNRDLLKRYFIFAGIQIVLFIPGLYVFIKQLIRVSAGFWISIEYPKIFLEIIEFPFAGKIENFLLVGIVVAIVYLCLIYNIFKYRKEKWGIIKLGIIALCINIGVIILALLVSFKTPIFTSRYTIPVIGLLIFFISIVMSLEKKNIITMIILVLISSLSLYNTILFHNINYDSENSKLEQEISKEIQENDIFIYTNIMTGSIMATYFQNTEQYFYNINNWSVEKAYGAFLPQMKCINDLSEINLENKRVWIIDGSSEELYNVLNDKEMIKTVIQKKDYYMPYSNTEFKISLVEF